MSDKLIPWLAFGFTLACSIAGVPVWWFSTFASKQDLRDVELNAKMYTDHKYVESVEHSDAAFKETQATLREIHDAVKTIEQRTWEERPALRHRP